MDQFNDLLSDETIEIKREPNESNAIESLEPDIPILIERGISNKMANKSIVEAFTDDTQDNTILIIGTTNQMNKQHMSLKDTLLNDNSFKHKSLPKYDIIEFDKNNNTNVYDNIIYEFDTNKTIKIGNIIRNNYNKYDGFVIISEMNQLPYISSYLSFILENLNKPCVITTSFTSFENVYNDAKLNLIGSMIISGHSEICEVIVCYNNKIYRGNRISLNDPNKYNAFDTPNCSILGQFSSNELEINQYLLLDAPKKRFKLFTKLFNNIIVIYLTPLMPITMIKNILFNDIKKGVILCVYGVGNLVQSTELKDIFTQSMKKYKTEIVITTQCKFGHVNINVYAAGKYYSNIGLINSSDMTIEACIAKLSYLMGKGYVGKKLKEYYEMDMRGEYTPESTIKGRIVDYKRKFGDTPQFRINK